MKLNITPGSIFTYLNDLYYYIGMNYNQTKLFYLPINFSPNQQFLQLDANNFDSIDVKSSPELLQHKNLSFYKD